MKNVLIILIMMSLCNDIYAQAVPSYVPTDSLIGWYPFNGNANNEYGSGKNGTVMGPALTTDRFGHPNSAYHFNGMLDHIVIDTTFFNVGWSNYTISLWMNSDSLDNPNNLNNNQVMINTIPHNGMGIGYNWGHSNKYSLSVNQNPGMHTWNILPGVTSNADISSHTWNHIVIVKRDTFSYSFYLNGVLDSTYTTSIAADNYFCKIFFGNIDSSIGNEGFRGDLDDYGIWNRALSNCEILRLYKGSSYLYITAQPVDSTVSLYAAVSFSISDTGVGNTYQWQVDTGTGYMNITGAAPYSGVTTPTLTITSTTRAMNGNKYRCIVNGAKGCSDISSGATLTISTLGINDINAPNASSIIPNPTTGNISVIGYGKVNIKVYDCLGRFIKQVNKTDKISIYNLPAGVYLIKLFNEEGVCLQYAKVLKL